MLFVLGGLLAAGVFGGLGLFYIRERERKGVGKPWTEGALSLSAATPEMMQALEEGRLDGATLTHEEMIAIAFKAKGPILWNGSGPVQVLPMPPLGDDAEDIDFDDTVQFPTERLFDDDLFDDDDDRE